LASGADLVVRHAVVERRRELVLHALVAVAVAGADDERVGLQPVTADAAVEDQLIGHAEHRGLGCRQLVEEQDFLLVRVEPGVALERDRVGHAPRGHAVVGVEVGQAAQVDAVVLAEPLVDEHGVLGLGRGLGAFGLAAARAGRGT
jgi:hypothetical protein